MPISINLPLPIRPRERMLMIKVDCGPCMKRTCPLDHRCMTGISSDMVLERARELLSERMCGTGVSPV